MTEENKTKKAITEWSRSLVTMQSSMEQVAANLGQFMELKKQCPNAEDMTDEIKNKAIELVRIQSEALDDFCTKLMLVHMRSIALSFHFKEIL